MSGDGYVPDGSLTISGNVLYGMTLLGGANNKGIIFSIALLQALTISLLPAPGTRQLC